MLAYLSSKFRNNAFGTSLRFITVCALVYFLVYRRWIAVIVALSLFGVDLLIAKVKIDALGPFIKLFTVMQGLLVWYFSSTTVMQLKILNSSLSIFNAHFDFKVELSWACRSSV